MESTAQDEYVSDFDLEHLEEVVKREMLEQRRAEAYAHHYQNLQPQSGQQQSQQGQQSSQTPAAVQQSQPVHVVSHHPSASVAATVQQPPVALKHQLQVIDHRHLLIMSAATFTTMAVAGCSYMPPFQNNIEIMSNGAVGAK